jgi:hypothetical protein
MKRTLTIPIEFELGKLEITCEVIKLEVDNPANHPDSNITHTITEFWCHEIEKITLNGHKIEIYPETSIKEAVEELITNNSNMWDE